MLSCVYKSLAALLSGKTPLLEFVNEELKILGPVSAKSKKAAIFLVSFVVPVLLVTQTSILVILIEELIKGKEESALSY